MISLAPGELHISLTDPILGSIDFLNEVMRRYPDAISFAPGAPHPTTLRDFDAEAHAQRYLAHRSAAGHDPESVRLSLLEYGPSRGLINDLIADAFRIDHGLDVNQRSIVVTVGAQEAMFLTLRSLCGPGDLLAVTDPSFPGIVGAARLLDIPVIPVSDSGGGPDPTLLRVACERARTDGLRIRACYVAPDHANPSGTLMSVPDRQALLELADREDLLLIEDNAYGFTSEVPAPPLKALDTARRVVHIGTFAKVAAPGARVGFVVADQPLAGSSNVLADSLASVKSMVTVNTSPLCQATIGGILLENGGSLLALGAQKGALYRSNLRHMLKALARLLPPSLGVTWERPGGGFFVRVALPVAVDYELLELSASRFGVLWTPMRDFYLSGGGENILRLSCSYLDHDQIDAGVARFSAFLREVL